MAVSQQTSRWSQIWMLWVPRAKTVSLWLLCRHCVLAWFPPKSPSITKRLFTSKEQGWFLTMRLGRPDGWESAGEHQKRVKGTELGWKWCFMAEKLVARKPVTAEDHGWDQAREGPALSWSSSLTCAVTPSLFLMWTPNVSVLPLRVTTACYSAEMDSAK